MIQFFLQKTPIPLPPTKIYIAKILVSFQKKLKSSTQNFNKDKYLGIRETSNNVRLHSRKTRVSLRTTTRKLFSKIEVQFSYEN